MNLQLRKTSLALTLICLQILISCASTQSKGPDLTSHLEDPQAPQKTLLKNQTQSEYSKVHGVCRIMREPGTSPELFDLCQKKALLLISKLKDRPVVTVIRTDEKGEFDVHIPSNSNWTINSATGGFKSEIELSPSQSTMAPSSSVNPAVNPAKDEKPGLSVILKPISTPDRS